MSANSEQGTESTTAARGKGHAVSRGVASLLNGSILTKEKVLGNMPTLFFLAALGLCMIAYGYWTERTVRELARTERELKNVRSEYITIRSELQKAEQQSSVADGIGRIGLRESRVPPRHMTVSPDQAK